MKKLIFAALILGLIIIDSVRASSGQTQLEMDKFCCADQCDHSYCSKIRVLPEFSSHITELILRYPGVEKLYLDNCNIGDAETIEIAKALLHTTALELLILRGNQIGDEGAVTIAEALQHANKLSALVLSSNLVSKDGATRVKIALPIKTKFFY